MRRIVRTRRHECHRVRGDDLSGVVEQLDRQTFFQLCRALERHVEVRLEPLGLVDGRDRRCRRHAIALTDRDIADDARHRRDDAVVLELDFAFLDLRSHRCQLRLGVLVGRLSLFQFGQADGSRLVQFLHARDLLCGKREVRLACGDLRLERGNRSLLPIRIDLNQRLARTDLIARLDENAADVALDLRLYGRRSQRPDRCHELGGSRDRLRFECQRHDIG